MKLIGKLVGCWAALVATTVLTAGQPFDAFTAAQMVIGLVVVCAILFSRRKTVTAAQ